MAPLAPRSPRGLVHKLSAQSLPPGNVGLGLDSGTTTLTTLDRLASVQGLLRSLSLFLLKPWRDNMSRPLPPLPSVGASYSRYSTTLQQVESIADQQRRCHEYAAQINLTIGPELQFADEAISGTKLARDGLDRLLAAARQHRFSTLLLEHLSRLVRESIIALPILKELVEIHGIRVISVSEGFDTSRGGWEMLAAFYSLQHERYVKDVGSAVLRGQEGVVLAGYSVGDMCFGYQSEPVPGTEVKRRGRHAKPRTRYVIDPVAAAWVVQIFQWFALEKRSMRWIAHELTRLGAPKDHRATTPG